MSDINDLIAKTSVRAYNQGIRTERDHIIKMLKDMKEHTDCDCSGCESWTNAFDFLMRAIEGKA